MEIEAISRSQQKDILTEVLRQKIIRDHPWALRMKSPPVTFRDALSGQLTGHP